MTPDVTRMLTQLRHEFYASFSGSFQHPVHITKGNPYCSSSSKVSWVDSQNKLNYLCMYAYTAPDTLLPDRPFILRIGINTGGAIDHVKTGRGHEKLNQGFSFSLTLLPEEVMDFLPWLVNLLRSYGEGSHQIPDPPHLLDHDTIHALLVHGAWTNQASVLFSNAA